MEVSQFTMNLKIIESKYTFLSLMDPSAKPDLGDVIIAAAAAKMVKLDPAMPSPTSQEFGAQYCRLTQIFL